MISWAYVLITNQDFQIKCTDLKIEFKKPALEYGTVPDPVFLTNIPSKVKVPELSAKYALLREISTGKTHIDFTFNKND